MLKNSLLATCLVLSASFVVPSVASASPYKGIAASRMVKQQNSIKRGVRNGSLTRAEARVLRAEQRRIAQTRKRMLRDGRISRAEARKLNRMQKRASKHIARAKHNKRRR